MKFMDALNALIKRGVTSELIAATKEGSSILILTDGPTPQMGVMTHSAYAISAAGVIEGNWSMEEEQIAVRWDAAPYEVMAVAIDKLYFNTTGLRGLNDRLEAQMKAAT